MVDDLCFDGQKYSGEEEVVNGFKAYFQKLAEHSININFDIGHNQNNETEFKHISDIVREKDVEPITSEELEKAVNNMNKGKSADIYGLTIESIFKY
ncbi:hypothetical protein DPMN_029881 [Dreissena polymorpha]|uniref:Uncharacterized protein n=1 Tax=Dreissena polymorpha TaxID=45954 RepID=A0A9D4LZI4_DREPO|nr:hypothetical protein DPMN_029881 [Dreissena polymorpha]